MPSGLDTQPTTLRLRREGKMLLPKLGFKPETSQSRVQCHNHFGYAYHFLSMTHMPASDTATICTWHSDNMYNHTYKCLRHQNLIHPSQSPEAHICSIVVETTLPRHMDACEHLKTMAICFSSVVLPSSFPNNQLSCWGVLSATQRNTKKCTDIYTQRDYIYKYN